MTNKEEMESISEELMKERMRILSDKKRVQPDINKILDEMSKYHEKIKLQNSRRDKIDQINKRKDEKKI